MRDLAVMQVQKIWRGIVRLQHRQVLRAKVRVGLLSGQNREQKTQVGVVAVQQIQPAEVHRVVTGNRGKVGIELVVGFRKEIAVRIGEDAGELADQLIQLRFRVAIENDGQREVAQRLTVAQCPQAIAEILDVRLLRLIDQHIAGIGLGRVVADLRDETGLRHIEVAAALVHFLARFVRGEEESIQSRHRSSRGSSAARPAPEAAFP